jgi:uncharacterized protein YpmB
MNLSSSFWIFIIVVGAGIVAIGNIQYSLARDKEKASNASQKALSMVAKESERNLARLNQMRNVMNENQVTIEGFETTAWNVVSGSGLLVQTETATLQEITETYYSIETANKYHNQIVDMSMGIQSVIGGVENSRAKYIGLLKNLLTELEPKLNEIITREKPKT